MVKQMGWIKLTVLVGLMLAAAEGTGLAWCGTCQVCDERNLPGTTLPRDTCMVANDEHGNLCCSEEWIGIERHCSESGSACYGTTVSGGGGSAGGGGSCSYVNGWCPAECYNCGGGGGGPFSV